MATRYRGYRPADHFLRAKLRPYLTKRDLSDVPGLQDGVMKRFAAVQRYLAQDKNRFNMLDGKYLATTLCNYEYHIHDSESIPMNFQRNFNAIAHKLNWPSKPKLLFEKAAIKIQKSFRLWRWRNRVLWNPHCDIGRAHLLIKAKCACR